MRLSGFLASVVWERRCRDGGARSTGDGFDASIGDAEDFTGESLLVASPADVELGFGRVGFMGGWVRSREGGDVGSVAVWEEGWVGGYVGD